jgi:hypothetical protein
MTKRQALCSSSFVEFADVKKIVVHSNNSILTRVARTGF